MERWYVAHSRAGHHTGLSVAMQLVSQAAAPPTMEHVQRILSRVAARFPWLRVKLRRDGVDGIDSRESLRVVSTTSDSSHGNGIKKEPLWGDDLYVTVDNDTSRNYCSLRQVTIRADDSYGMAGGLAPILEQEGRTEWHDEDPNAPLWRAVLVKYENSDKFALVLSFHHLITDGMGAIAVCQAIVEESGADTTTPIPMQHSILPPPMEDVLDTVPRLSHLLIPVLLDRFPSLTSILRPPHFQGMSHDSTIPAKDRTSNMVCLPLLNDNQVLLLREYCRRNKVTVNSVCVSSLCRAISMHVQENPDLFASSPGVSLSNKVHLKIITAVNERPDCGMINKDLGVYLVGPQVFVDVFHEPNTTVGLASLYQTKLSAARSPARMDMGLCKFISEDWIEFSQKHANREPNGREDSVEVSNLGLVSFDSASSLEDAWSVESLWFAQGRNVTGPALAMTMVTSNGGLKAVLSAIPQAITRESLVAIGESFQNELLALLDEMMQERK